MITSVIEMSPESARIVLLASNTFLSDDTLDLAAASSGTVYLKPVQLVQNAIDFSRPGGTITIAARADGPMLRLCVEDSGTAIPAYAREKIFEKFYSLKRPDSGRKSTGLGLNLVRQVALLHNGDIQLHNRERQGVRAVLSLPKRGYRRHKSHKPGSEEMTACSLNPEP